MSRYVMEMYIRENDEWCESNFTFSSRAKLESWLEDDCKLSGERRGTNYYEWRAGFVWKLYDDVKLYRFVWNSGKKKGEVVKV